MDTETKNRPIRKVAFTIIFATLLVVIAWLSILVVRNVPGSFASLASLAESVRNFDTSRLENTATSDEDRISDTSLENMLIVTSDTNVTQTGNNVRLSWTDASAAGSFVFKYECIEGVALDIVEADGVRAVSCDTNYNLGDVNNLTIAISSEKERFTDLPYSIAFLSTGDTTPQAIDTALITVVNDSVPLTFAEETSETEPATDVPSEPTSPTEGTENEPAISTPPATETPTFEQQFTFTIPVSDPNGRTDLATRFIAVGSIVNNSFVSGIIDNDDQGAIQFEVKNLGTKTSNDWTYSLSLPSGGMIESADQAPLKPNERALITIGFPPSSVTEHDFMVTIDTTGDNTSLNDRFVEEVSFRD